MVAEKKSQKIVEEKRLAAFFLPDLCNVRAVLALVLVSELLVVALLLAQYGLLSIPWEIFGIVSFFVLWVSLVSATLLCQSRSFLVHMSVAKAMAFALMLILFATLSISLMAQALMPGSFAQDNIDWLWILRNMLVSSIFGGMALRYFYVQSQWRMKSQAELTSRLQALQARIRPHFFFNTLNTVASLIVIDAEKAEAMLLDLAQLFRVVLKEGNEQTSLADELELARKYIEIEQTRLGRRLKINWQLPEQLAKIQVPQLLLQPLLENAVYHGIQPMPQGGEISIKVRQGSNHCLIEIDNDMLIQDAEKISKGQVLMQGNGIALDNTKQRLEATYHGTASVHYQPVMQQEGSKQGIFHVEIKLPLKMPLLQRQWQVSNKTAATNNKTSNKVNKR